MKRIEKAEGYAGSRPSAPDGGTVSVYIPRKASGWSVRCDTHGTTIEVASWHVAVDEMEKGPLGWCTCCRDGCTLKQVAAAFWCTTCGRVV